MSIQLSRRQFLKLSALGLGLAVLPTLPVKTLQACGLPAAPPAIFNAQPRPPMVALTFDDGFVNVARFLDQCKELDLKLTLFPLGKVIEAKPELWQRALAEGHEIGCHTYSHLAFEGQPYDVIARELETFMKVARTYLSLSLVRYLRPPYGSGWNFPAVQQAARNFGMRIVMWNRTNDMYQFSATPTGLDVKTAFCQEAHSGDIFLYHFRYQEVAALKSIAQWCKERSWQIGTVSQLLEAKKAEAAATK